MVPILSGKSYYSIKYNPSVTTMAKSLKQKMKQEKDVKVLLKSYSKTIKIEDGKLYDGIDEVRGDVLKDLMKGAAEPHGGNEENTATKGQQIVRDYYKRLLSRPFENIIVFTGAGISKPSGGPLMKDLWLEAFPAASKAENEQFFKRINYSVPEEDSQKNIEELLSHAQKAVSVLAKSESDKVVEKIKAIKKIIIDKCTLSLSSTAPHQTFLNKITSRKLKYSRVKVFTLNYDTLFEQAAAEGGFIVVNGFSFSQPSYFNGLFFDYDVVNRKDSRVIPEENFVSKLFHLYKPHGSINWEKSANGRVLAKDIAKACAEPHIIYPNSDKYEYGYDQPFFEMMSRFQQAVRQPNTLLVCVGFGFGDKHFKNIIIESVKSNPGLNLLVALPRFAEKTALNEILDLSERQNNIVLIDEGFQEFTEHYPFSGEYEHDDGEQ